MKTKKKSNRFVLTADQEALLTNALQHVVHVGAEVDDLDVIEYEALKADAAFGRKMRRESEVTDDALLVAYDRVRRDFPGLKAREHYRRVGIDVRRPPLSWSQTRDRLLRLRKK